jgi:predicted MPP superfamily phosphohydrolase
MPIVRTWATVALIATIIAACFGVIIIGLDAKAVQVGRNLYSSLPSKTNIIVAQLSFAILELILCLVFIGLYIAVYLLAPRRVRRAHRVYVY